MIDRDVEDGETGLVGDFFGAPAVSDGLDGEGAAGAIPPEFGDEEVSERVGGEMGDDSATHGSGMER